MSNSSRWRAYAGIPEAEGWIHRAQGLQGHFVCAFGFTNTALIPGISAAGATPEHRRHTAIADAEVLISGFSTRLPTSPAGYPSPVVISRALLAGLEMPMDLWDCGLPETVPGLLPAVPAMADCLSTGQAMRPKDVQERFELGLAWGSQRPLSTLILGECVAGGTTTALAVLLGLGWPVSGMVNSSHPTCNHQQKLQIVQQGLACANLTHPTAQAIVAAVGDPMQPFMAGLALGSSRRGPVLLAGGTQMLAVYALMRQWAQEEAILWDPEQVVIGTTRWVAEDPTGNTVGLATLLGDVPLLATQLNLGSSRYPQLQAYEQGHIKEGVGAGGLSLWAGILGWDPGEQVAAIEAVYQMQLEQAATRSADRLG